MRTLEFWLARLLAGFLLCIGCWAPAQAQVPVPELTAQVMDFTGTLNDTQLAALREKLANFERTGGTQIVVLMVDTTYPEDIAAYANRVASTWKVGRKDVGDGLVLVVAKSDRRLRIEVARALEGAVTDLGSRQVIDTVITPRFKAGDFAGGLDAGLDAIFRLVRNEALPTPMGEVKARVPLTVLDLVKVFGIGFAIFAFVGSHIAGRKMGVLIGLFLSIPGIFAFWLGWFVGEPLEGATTYYVMVSSGTAMLFGMIYEMLTSPNSASRRGVAGGSSTSSSGNVFSNWSSDSGISSSSGGYSSGGGGSYGGGGSSGSW